jgi:hypothetical protein
MAELTHHPEWQPVFCCCCCCCCYGLVAPATAKDCDALAMVSAISVLLRSKCSPSHPTLGSSRPSSRLQIKAVAMKTEVIHNELNSRNFITLNTDWPQYLQQPPTLATVSAATSRSLLFHNDCEVNAIESYRRGRKKHTCISGGGAHVPKLWRRCVCIKILEAVQMHYISGGGACVLNSGGGADALHV